MQKIKPSKNGDILYTTVHDFKTHLSKYMAALESAEFCAIAFKRRHKEGCVFWSMRRMLAQGNKTKAGTS